MKIKRFLAFVISLAMVLSVVPAFNLTASAAELTATISKSISYHTSGSAVVKKSGLDDNSSSRDLYVYHSGWNQRVGLVGFTMPEIPEDEYVTKATLRLYANAKKVYGRVSIGSVNNSWNESSYVEEETIGIPTYAHSNTVTTLPSGFTVLDEKSVNAIDTWYEFDVTDYVQGFSSNEEISFVATHLTYNGETNGSEVCHLSFAGRTKGDLAPQLVIETAEALTVKYVDDANNEIVKTVAGFTADDYIGTIGGNVVVDGGFYVVTGKSSSDGIVVINVKKKANASSNMFINGDFEDGFNGWTTGKGAALSNNYFAKRTNLLDNSTALFAYKNAGDMTTDSSMQQPINITGGKDYFISFNQMRVKGSTQYSWFETMDSNSGTLQVFADNTSGKTMSLNTSMSIWQKTFTANSNATQFTFKMCWPQDTNPVYDNFELYELTKIPATITINYVDESGAEIDIKDDVITDKYVGDSYTTSLPASIVDNNGTTYVRVDENETTLDWVSENASFNVINAVYKADSITSAENVTGITTRVGVVPTLPATVTATLGSGNTMTAAVTWETMTTDMFDVAVGETVTVNGSVTDDVSVTATVTVINKDTYLLAHYAFEDETQTNGATLADETTNGYVATVSGDDLSSVEGVFGNAINLDGTGYLTLSDDLTQAIMDAVDAGEGFTMSTFVKKNVAQNQFLFSMHNTNADLQAYERAYGLIDSAGNDALRFEGTKDYQAITPTRKMYAKSGTHANADSEFVHLAVTFDYTSGDGLGLIKFYINGEDVTDTSRGVNLTNGKIDFTPSQVKAGSLDGLYTFVGLSPYWGDGNYNGYLDDFKIYSVALTADEVADIGAKHTTTVKYVADGVTVKTEELSGWEGQSVTFSGQVQDADEKWYNVTDKTITIDEDVTEVDVTVELDVSTVDIVATYKLPDGTVLDTKTKTINTNEVTSATFDEMWYYANGVNEIYYVAATSLSQSGDITLQAKTYPSAYEKDAEYTAADGKKYVITTGNNLIANGNFADGLKGWYNGMETEAESSYFVVQNDGTIKATNDNSSAGTGSVKGLYRAWNVEVGKTYLLTFTLDDKIEWATVTEGPVARATTTNTIKNTNSLVGGTNNIAFTASDEYVRVNFGWCNGRLIGNFGLYELTEQTTDYTVVYNWADKTETVTKSINAAANIKGYNDEVIFPDVEIPYKEGYVFKNKTVAGSNGSYTVTLNYEATDANAYFFEDVTDDTTFVSLNMLGAHDAFTANLATGRKDAAAVAQGDSGAQGALTGLGFNKSKAQSADALTMLNHGVRYFDIRLSRSDKEASYVLTKVPHTNGVYYTTHGYLGEEFRPIAYTIAQWAKEHPGEIIVLDFQETYDYTGEHDGNALQDSELAIDAILEEAGVKEFVTVSNGSIKGHTYGSLTNNGEKAGIVLFARNRETAYGNRDFATVGNFILRGTNDNAFVGKMYSNYDKGDASIGSSLTNDYIAAQVAHLDKYQEIDGDYENGDSPIVFMYRVMQAISDSSNLISQAATDNTFVTEAVKSNSTWLTSLPVIMVNDAVTNTADLVEILKNCNVARETTINYVDSTGTVKTVTENLMVGTLYTGDVRGGIVSTDTADYYVADDIHTKPYTKVSDVWTWTRTIIPVPYNSAITVNVGKLDNVYTLYPYSGIVNANNLTDDGTYKGFDNFGAFTWDANKAERIGVAILDADMDSQAYQLSGDVIRRYGASTVKFYAVPFEAYDKVWRTDMTQIINMLTDDTLVATLKTTDSMENTTLGIMLDAEKVKAAIDENGKVVIIGDARSGLFGYSGDSMEIISGWKITTDGTETVVATGGTYTLPSDALVYADEAAALYAPAGVVTITADKTFTGRNDLGVDMVNGAQVRIGDGVVKETYTDDEGVEHLAGTVAGDSGLRFITQVDKNDTIAGFDAVSGYGVLITAEGSNTVVDIPAKQWQSDSIFTSALTDLKVSNYNRNFTATPYVTYTDAATGDTKAILGAPVTRSIYQVAAGLLAGDSTDEDQQTASEYLYKVLNGYVNQTGVRLIISDGALVKSDKYTGSADTFFTVSNASMTNNVYTCTLKAVGNAKINTDLFNTYVRINNNNSQIKTLVEIVDNNDGTYTLTFDATSLQTTAE